MASLDSIINFALPIGIIIFLLVLMFEKVREPLFSFFGWVKNLFSSATDRAKDVELHGDIIYR